MRDNSPHVLDPGSGPRAKLGDLARGQAGGIWDVPIASKQKE